jgi:hypothetical protein
VGARSQSAYADKYRPNDWCGLIFSGTVTNVAIDRPVGRAPTPRKSELIDVACFFCLIDEFFLVA